MHHPSRRDVACNVSTCNVSTERLQNTHLSPFQESGIIQRGYNQKNDLKIYLNSKEVEQLENFNLADTPCLEADHDRWLLSCHFLLH